MKTFPIGDEREDRRDPGRQGPSEDPIDRFQREQEEDRSFDFSEFEDVEDDVLEHEEDEGE